MTGRLIDWLLNCQWSINCSLTQSKRWLLVGSTQLLRPIAFTPTSSPVDWPWQSTSKQCARVANYTPLLMLSVLWTAFIFSVYVPQLDLVTCPELLGVRCSANTLEYVVNILRVKTYFCPATLTEFDFCRRLRKVTSIVRDKGIA